MNSSVWQRKLALPIVYVSVVDATEVKYII